MKNLEHKPDKIYIIDDGSDDETSEIARHSGTNVTTLPENKGKGFALKTGFSEFIRSKDAEYLICMDADLQHPVASIPEFLELAFNKIIDQFFDQIETNEFTHKN